MAAFTTTLSGAYISPLILPERVRGYTVRYFIPYTAIAVTTSAATADTQTVTLGTTPTTWLVSAAMADVGTAFAGLATQGLTMSVGTTSVLTAFLASSAVTGTAMVIQATSGPNTVNTPASSFGSSSLSIVATFTNSVSGNLSTLTAGSVVVELSMTDPTAIP